MFVIIKYTKLLYANEIIINQKFKIMAKQVGLVKYEGTMGDIRHFKIKGLEGNYAGLKGGPTKEQILNDPAFKRTRENMSEFAGSATAAKSVRVGLASLVKTMGDPRVSARLTKVFRSINREANGKRGERPILLTANKAIIKGFNFDKKLALASILTAPYTLADNVDRNEVTMTIPDFNPADYIAAPAGATHFKLINAIASVSDYAFDKNTGKFGAKVEAENGLGDVAKSAQLPLDVAVGAVTTLIATIPGAPVLSADVGLIACVGIEFYQKVGTEFYLFASGNAMKVIEVF